MYFGHTRTPQVGRSLAGGVRVCLLGAVLACSCVRAHWIDGRDQGTFGQDALADVDRDAPGVRDGAVGEVSDQDLSMQDASARDSPVPDSGICPTAPETTTVALYRFEESGGPVILDATGRHFGTLVGAEGQDWLRIASSENCGRAIQFEPPAEVVPLAKVAHHLDWDLQQGSIEILVRFDNPTPTDEVEAIVSRDAEYTDRPGHLLLFRACNSRIAVRLQRDADHQFLVCSNPVTANDWHRVGINFGGGPLELYVDGQRATSTEPLDCVTEPGDWTCGTGNDTAAGIDGNANPWVIGALSWSNPEGQWNVVASRPLVGAVDSFHIRRERRNFAD